jgi:membrane protease YdiL (CAAX protease family)
VERARRFVVVVLAATIAFAGVMLIARWSVQVGPSWLRAGGTSFVLPWLALLALAALWWPDARVRWRPRPGAWRSWAALLAILVAVAGVVWLYAGMLTRVVSLGATVPNLTMAVVSGVVLGPIAEEWIFRGILWRQLVPGEAAPPRASRGQDRPHCLARSSAIASSSAIRSRSFGRPAARFR